MKNLFFLFIIFSVVACGSDEVYEPPIRKIKKNRNDTVEQVTVKQEFIVPNDVSKVTEMKAETLKIMSITLVNNDSCKYICQTADSTWAYFIDKKGRYNPGTRITNPFVVLGSAVQKPVTKSFTRK